MFFYDTFTEIFQVTVDIIINTVILRELSAVACAEMLAI